MRGLFPGSIEGEGVLEEVPESGVAEPGVGVFLDDVEGEVVGAGEAPDGDREEEGDAPGGVFEEDAGGGEGAGEEEEGSLQIEEPRVADDHASLFAASGDCFQSGRGEVARLTKARK